VEVIESFKDWETMRSDAEIFGKRLLVVYTGPDGGGKAVEDLERIAGAHSSYPKTPIRTPNLLSLIHIF
jgi:hypothetical protein